MNNNKSPKLSEEDILSALTNSGYMFESRVCKLLNEKGFFVQPNQMIRDTITGKSREIDIVAEYYDWNKPIDREIQINVKINYIFEVKNNQYPFVLLTKYTPNPNIEIYESLREWITGNDLFQNQACNAFYNMILENETQIFFQYCSFLQKKGSKELMALHSDDFHEGLSKIIQYCDESSDRGRNNDEEYATIDRSVDNFNRCHLCLPVLLISNDLYELEIDEEFEPILKQVDSSILMYNYHSDNRPENCSIFIVTEKGLLTFLNKMETIVEQIEKNIRQELQSLYVQRTSDGDV